ncbi:MAG: hypothetical protein MI807_03955 [Verrucomicrobiales bacterium]|nr:hypothetical protein [Verrucomicrobiales bacterium]
MDKDPGNWKYPALVGVTGPGINVIPVRELTDEEVSKVAEYAKTSSDAKARFKLFTILSRNYAQWSDYIKSLLVATNGLEEEQTVELDRLQLNFHSAAKATLDHFKQHWIQKHRKTGRKKEFREFIGKLEDTSWAFAFFQDLRNFTQHCGLPVGNYSRKVGLDSVKLTVECDPDWLVENYSGWEKSKLTKEHANLDLLSLSREYYVYLQRDFGNFVATEFAPDLLEAHNFFMNLAAEVAEVNPRAKFNLATGYSNIDDKMNFQFSAPPADLLGSIGITVREKPENETEAEQGVAGKTGPAAS